MKIRRAQLFRLAFLFVTGLVFIFVALANIRAAVGVPLQAPPNDDFDNATVIMSTPYADMVNTIEATPALDDPLLECALGGAQQGGNTIWYRFVAPSKGILRADTFGTLDEDTIIGVWTGTRGSLTSVACNDDASNAITNSFVNPTLVRGVTYYIETASFSPTLTIQTPSPTNAPNGGGNVILHVNFLPPTYLPFIVHTK